MTVGKQGSVICCAMCLVVLLIMPAKIARPQGLTECEEDTRKVAEQQSVLTADYDTQARAREKIETLHSALSDSVARLQANLGQGEQAIRTIIAILSQMKQARADLRAINFRIDADEGVRFGGGTPQMLF